MIEQGLGRFLHQIKHVLEAGGAAVIRIGNLVDTQMRGELQQQRNAILVARRADGEQVLEIVSIHRDDVVEGAKVVTANTAGPVLRNVEAAPTGRFGRPLVRLLADVIAGSAGRIDLDLVAETAFVD